MDHEAYKSEGRARAALLDNRGRHQLDATSPIDDRVVDQYLKHGFYVLEDVLDESDIVQLRSEVTSALKAAPFPDEHSAFARDGSSALGSDLCRSPWEFARPLSDPLGGTLSNNGRHPVKMPEPEADPSAPKSTPYLLRNCLELLPSLRYLYGHPGLLSLAERLCGKGFTPFTEAAFIKEPYLGPSIAWHQDGQLHWDIPDWTSQTHGFNFQVQLYDTTAANALWVWPGSHTFGKVDIERIVLENGESPLLLKAVPVLSRAGSVVICNRQTLHGSFANNSNERRVSLNFGFLPRERVLGVTGVLRGEGKLYDHEYIWHSSERIRWAIAERCKKYPDEASYEPGGFSSAEGSMDPAIGGGLPFPNGHLWDIGI